MNKFMIFLALIFIGFTAQQANADTFIYGLGTTFSGTSPNGAAPWVTATFTDAGVNDVQLTISTKPNSGGAGLIGSENIDTMYFNFDPSKTAILNGLTAGPLLPDHTLNPDGTTLAVGEDAFKADGTGGQFDILFQFPHGNPDGRFGANQSYTYTLSSTGGTLTAAMFKFTSTMMDGSAGYSSAAHIQNTGSDYNSSGWISTVAVPEPATYITLGSLLGIALLLKNRRALAKN